MSGAAVRPMRGRDPLGLARALDARLLPATVAAMALLAALALGGAAGASRLAARWAEGAGVAVSVELPAGTDPAAVAATVARLAALPGVAAAELVDPARLAAALRPWLGELAPPATPPLIELRATARDPDLARRVAAAVPLARVDAQGPWVAALLGFAERVRLLALAALGLTGAVAAAVIAGGVRSGIAARREQIAILHQLGATDAAIAGRFAARIARLSASGAAAGALLAVPVLASLAALGAPLLGAEPEVTLDWSAVPFAPLAALPVGAAGIGWLVAQGSVRLWLWRLP